MGRQSILKILFLSLLLSSCGLIEKWRTPEQPTDSNTSSNEAESNSGADDLFSKTMNETKEQPESPSAGDAPSNISDSNPENADLNSLESEFAADSSKSEEKNVAVEEASPQIKAEESPALAQNETPSSDAGKTMEYKVQKGETLMQIAFKIYGDIGKWKELRELNQEKFGKSPALRSGMELKYKAPANAFVWNPEGVAHLIKTGETLGTISNTVYQTPKKWKQIWENNKPLIKNPNIIFAGFTLYYKKDGLANYVQPKSEQKKIIEGQALKSHNKIEHKIDEEVKVEQAISRLEQSTPGEIDLTNEVQSAPIRSFEEEIPEENMREDNSGITGEGVVSR